jgi:NADPH-dependent curcumin reductase CurA
LRKDRHSIILTVQDKDYAKHLADALPDYADHYFDNVGGEILNTMFTLVKRYGYISSCGAISGMSVYSQNLPSAYQQFLLENDRADTKVTTTKDSP